MSGFAMGAGGTNAHGDARHNQGRRHVHAHEHETTEWLLDPLTKMTAVELNQLLMERSNELDHEIEDEKAAVAAEREKQASEKVVKILEARVAKMEHDAMILRASRVACCEAGSAGTHHLRGAEQLEGKPLADPSKGDDDDYHRFMVNLCLLNDVTAIRPGKTHKASHVCAAVLKGAPWWSVLSIACMIVGAIWSIGRVGTLTTAVESLGFGAASRAGNIFVSGLVLVLFTDLVALVVCILFTGHSVHTACGKHGCCRIGAAPRHHRPRHNRAEKLLYWGWIIEIVTAVLCYLSAALMFFALGFVTVTWTLVTVLTGVCATKGYEAMGNFLALLPADMLETKQDLPWAENIEQYCETAAATCLEKYDSDSFFNMNGAETDLTVEELCAVDPTEQYEIDAWAMLLGVTLMFIAQVNLVMRSGVSVFQVRQEIDMHTEQAEEVKREKNRKIMSELADAEAEEAAAEADEAARTAENKDKGSSDARP